MYPNLKEAQDVPKPARPLNGQFLSVPGLVMEENLPAQYQTVWTSRQNNANVAGKIVPHRYQ